MANEYENFFSVRREIDEIFRTTLAHEKPRPGLGRQAGASCTPRGIVGRGKGLWI
jgi:hypothetical protein